MFERIVQHNKKSNQLLLIGSSMADQALNICSSRNAMESASCLLVESCPWKQNKWLKGEELAIFRLASISHLPKAILHRASNWLESRSIFTNDEYRNEGNEIVLAETSESGRAGARFKESERARVPASAVPRFYGGNGSARPSEGILRASRNSNRLWLILARAHFLAPTFKWIYII